MFKVKLMMVVALFTAMLSSSYAVAGDYKLKLTNTFPIKMKVSWYCKGKRKDSDTFPPYKTKTRKLSTKKCRNVNDLTVKFSAQTGGQLFSKKAGWWKIRGFFNSSAYKNVSNDLPHNWYNNIDASIIRMARDTEFLTEMKFDKLDGGGSKRCVVTSVDAITAVSTGYTYMPAVYPKRC